MTYWYERTIQEGGRSGPFWMLVSFLVVFLLTRAVVRLIRAGKFPVGNVEVGSTHVHHQVFGIVIVLSVAALEFTYQPESPGLEILAAAFGAGAALTLDEFALWLHLEDVYWSEEGRKSVDAVVAAAIIGVLLILGVSPLDVDSGPEQGRLAVAIASTINICFTLVAVLKGRILMGVIGLFVPLLSFIAACRLARPESPFARWRYGERKLERAQRRFTEEKRRRADRLKDLVAGAPSPPPAP